jgi:hypothetical protein
MVLRIFVFRYADQSDVNNGLASNVGDWCAGSYSFAITYNNGNSQTQSVTFTADKTAMFVIESYMWHNTGTHNDGTRSYGVTTNWYKLEKGDTATAWQAGIDDQVIWKNYITNPLATDAAIGQDVTSHSIITDARFGRVRKIEASANGNWQLTFTAGNNYDELVGKVATFFIICKRYGDNYAAVGAKTEQLVFGGGDENVNVIHTNNCEFRDLGDGWRLYYSSRQIKTGLMANSQGIDSGVIGVNTLKGTWLIYAAGVVQGGVCPAVADIMEACGLLATGIDITNKKVVITADNFTVQTNSGQKALVAADGKVNIQLLDAVQIVANGIRAQTIDAQQAVFQNIRVTGNSEFNGTVKANLLYFPVKTVSVSSYQIDPVNEPFTTFVYNGISGRNWIYLPKASDYDGMEITIFQKLTATINVTENYLRILPKTNSGDSIYIQQNISIVTEASNYYANPRSIPTHNYSANYYAVTSSVYLIPNCVYVFKSMLGAWYAIQGLFTGE